MSPSASSSTVTLCAAAVATIHYRVGRLIGRHGFTEQDRADLEQELALDLIERLPAFDPARAACSTFVARCVEHRIANLLRDRRRLRRDPRRMRAISDDDADACASVPASSLLDQRAAAERTRSDVRMDLGDAIAALPPRLRTVCVLLVAHTPFAIARRLGVSKRHVYRDVATIRAAFAAAGLESYLR